MPSIEENLKIWSNFIWIERGDIWSKAWGGTEYLWYRTIYPRIFSFVPAKSILEIAPGYGRCTQYLKDLAEELSIVDLTERCIEYCKQRFKDKDNLNYYVNDGKSLDMIPDDSIDFIFSWDSLVHCEKDVLEEYVYQFSKKLKPNGVGFIHHSNLANYDGIEVANVHKRGTTMSAELFNLYCQENNLKCIYQEKIKWGSDVYNDCFSLFTRQSNCPSIHNIIYKNDNFEQEVLNSGNIANNYNPKKKELVLKTKNESLDTILKNMKGKRFVGWGTGKTYRVCQSLYQFDLDYFVDSDQNKQGSFIDNKKIFKPEKLLSESKKDIYIIIFTKAYDTFIYEWLLNHGFEKKSFHCFSEKELSMLSDYTR